MDQSFRSADCLPFWSSKLPFMSRRATEEDVRVAKWCKSVGWGPNAVAGGLNLAPTETLLGQFPTLFFNNRGVSRCESVDRRDDLLSYPQRLTYKCRKAWMVGLTDPSLLMNKGVRLHGSCKGEAYNPKVYEKNA
ncbi:hypothetical protein ACJJTC_017612 [Scirpophaga incertulas]